jgi:uncharacterized membrane protein YdjX (TVP38/TMEM64 family)
VKKIYCRSFRLPSGIEFLKKEYRIALYIPQQKTSAEAIMRISHSFVATLLLLLLPTTLVAWTIQSQFLTVRPTVPIRIPISFTSSSSSASTSASASASSSSRRRATRIEERTTHKKRFSSSSKLQAINNNNNQSPFNTTPIGGGTTAEAIAATATAATIVKIPGLNRTIIDEKGGIIRKAITPKFNNAQRRGGGSSTGSTSSSSNDALDNNNNNNNNNNDIQQHPNGGGDNGPSLLLLATIVSILATVAVGISSSSSSHQIGGGAGAVDFSDFSPSTLLLTGSNFVGQAREVIQDPGTALDKVVELTDSMGTLGIVYFGIAYCIAEILAIPAIPLTASAGYLFGPVKGTAIVLLSASIAAAISFTIGRTLLRDYVEGVLIDYPKFAKLDRAIGREGFKLMLLLRLSPIFPFALSNYLYGASSINFTSFFGGTILGFAPGTIAYVYTGYVGKALNGGAGSDVYPWYVYAGGLSIFAGVLKVVADTATRVVEEIEAEEEAEAEGITSITRQSNDIF